MKKSHLIKQRWTNDSAAFFTNSLDADSKVQLWVSLGDINPENTEGWLVVVLLSGIKLIAYSTLSWLTEHEICYITRCGI